MDQFTINRELLKKAIDLYYIQFKPTEAIETIDRVLQTDKNSFAYSLKARILKDLGKTDDALKTIDEGLGHYLKDHVLLKLKAEIFAYILFKPAEAIAFVQQAQLFFEESNAALKSFIKSLPGYDESEYLIGYLGTKAELKILESDIKNLHNSMFVLDQAKNIEKRLIGERVRIIELLGLFTAIFAFIFSSVQIFTKVALTDALVLQTGVALLLLTFLIALHMVLAPEARTKPLAILLLILIVVLVLLPFYAKFLRTTSLFGFNVNTIQTEQEKPAMTPKKE